MGGRSLEMEVDKAKSGFGGGVELLAGPDQALRESVQFGAPKTSVGLGVVELAAGFEVAEEAKLQAEGIFGEDVLSGFA